MNCKVIVGSDLDNEVMYDGANALEAAEHFRTFVEHSATTSGGKFSGQRVVFLLDGEVLGELTERQAVDGRMSDPFEHAEIDWNAS